ncbi:MAG: NotI family restriction endonuclease [Anaerolineales bacterium]
MPKNPLAEVFGFPVNNMSEAAVKYRKNRLCPFHNSSGPNCTKTSAHDPLGVCSIYQKNEIVITCPVRFRQDLRILADVGRFFFGDQKFVALTEVRINDRNGKSAGNIDIVLALLNKNKNIFDFAAIEIQAVYIAGNINGVFKKYMESPENNWNMEWPKKDYPKPDYLASSRKRLVSQLLFKGNILHAWRRKMAVAVHRCFFEELPEMDMVGEQEAEIAWFIYDLEQGEAETLCLKLVDIKYTKFKAALARISTPEVGEIDVFKKSAETRIKSGNLFGEPLSSLVEPSVEPVDV